MKSTPKTNYLKTAGIARDKNMKTYHSIVKNDSHSV